LPVLGQFSLPPPGPSEVPPKAALYFHYLLNVAKKVVRTPVSLHTFGALRRTLLPQILPDELLYRWKPYQQGECNRCGACCQIQFQCSFMVQDDPTTTHCRIYMTEHAPKACLMFPIDPLDLHMLQREIDNRCVFYYEGAPEPIPRLEYASIVARHLVERTRRSWRNRKRRPALESVD